MFHGPFAVLLQLTSYHGTEPGLIRRQQDNGAEPRLHRALHRVLPITGRAVQVYPNGGRRIVWG
jgi:hypothetical protein